MLDSPLGGQAEKAEIASATQLLRQVYIYYICVYPAYWNVDIWVLRPQAYRYDTMWLFYWFMKMGSCLMWRGKWPANSWILAKGEAYVRVIGRHPAGKLAYGSNLIC